jgi:dethiobiotin synthetase
VTERPSRLLVFAGTGTGVGKTWAAAALARVLAPQVAVRKPVQSFDAHPTDAELLAAASGEAVDDVCAPHRSYELAVAPFMAAARLGRPPFTLVDLVTELRWPAVGTGIVEAAGGVRSPMTSDGADTVDLCDALRPDGVVLVADAGLGTLNAVRLCVDALAGHPVTIFLNRFDPTDPLHVDNREWLRSKVTFPLATEVQELGG